MKAIKLSLYLICSLVFLLSCNITSNSLKQENAENTIRKFLSINTIETSEVIISPQTIKKIGNTNIFSQFNTSVKVYFSGKDGQDRMLLFIFTRTAKNKWFLQSVEEVGEPIKGLSDWLSTKKKLNIAVQ